MSFLPPLGILVQTGNTNDDAMTLGEIPCLFYLLSTSADTWNKNDDEKSLPGMPCLFYLPSSSGGCHAFSTSRRLETLWNNNNDLKNLRKIQSLGIMMMMMQQTCARFQVYSTSFWVPVETLGIIMMMQWAYDRFHAFSTSFGSSVKTLE